MQRTIDILERAKTETVSPDSIFQAVCLDVAGKTGANRVSIWHLEQNGGLIRCACFYEAAKEKGTEAFSSGQILFARDYPTYFKTILAEQLIVAPDARTHPATAELTDGYFVENGIHSLLDFVIHDNFKPIGVICCENAGARRDWQDDDVGFLRQIATLISFYIE